MTTVLSETVGYLIILGVGLVMALAVTLLIKAETRWLGTKKTSEWFSTAGRTVKTGLLAASVVSAWTWAATLLQSSTVAYQFGISGPFWYAAGASIQVVLFAILAIELKRKAPGSHTFPEIINARYGRHAHKIFLFFALMTNTVVTAMLVLGGAAVVSSLTGMNIYIAAFLIPLGVIIYTFFGGLKATFLADYLHTAVIFAGVLTFVTAIYFTNPEIGGISGMFDKLTAVASLNPVEGNAMGAYLTLASTGALIFGVINIVGNFGTVFVDQAYWQRAIAAGPKAAAKGFLVGGLAWFAIPFALATSLGLAAVAVGVPLTEEQIGLGLVAPSSAAQVLGDVGAILILTMLFIAVTSAGSAELVAVSSLVTYDVYRTYVKPSANDRELMRASRLLVIGFGLGMGLLASTLLQIGVGLQYVYLSMGILIGSAVAPIALSILWKRTNRIAASAGAIVGLLAGVGMWLYFANALYGEISIASTGQHIPFLIGNVTSISVGAVLTVLGSVIRPENFNFGILKQKIVVMDRKIQSVIEQGADEIFLSNAARFTYKYAIVLTLVLVVVWPLPLYFSGYVFSQATYYIWVSTAFVWAAGAAAVIIILPLIESRTGIMEVMKNLIIPFILAAIIVVAIAASLPLYSSQIQQDEHIANLSRQELERELSSRSILASQITEIHLQNVIDTLDMISETSLIHGINYDTMRSVLQSAQNRNSDLANSYFIFDENANLIASSVSDVGETEAAEMQFPIDHVYVEGKQSTEPFISDVLQTSNNERVIYVYTPLISNENEFHGIVGTLVNGEELTRSVRLRTGLDERLVLADPNGKLLYLSSAQSFLQNQYKFDSESLAESDGNAISADLEPNTYLDGITKIDGREYGILGVEEENSLIAYSPVQVNGEVVLIAYVIGSLDSETLISQLSASERSLNLTFIYGILGVMGGFAAVVIILNRRLTKLVGIRTKELERANQELKHKDRLKDEFISIASHELRTPVQPILGFASLAKKGKIEQERAWYGVQQHARRLQHLANEILDVSRIESGSLRYNMEKVSINSLILGVTNTVKANLSKEISLEVGLDKDVEIHADRGRITQVLMNIIDNAIKFTDGGTIRIETFLFEEKGKIEIKISDTGVGIASDIIPHLFEKFVTNSSQHGNQHGAGLGLFISRAIVNAHNGEIIAQNNPEAGATFTIILPIDQNKWI